jgi:hypothetical protein
MATARVHVSPASQLLDQVLKLATEIAIVVDKASLLSLKCRQVQVGVQSLFPVID